MRILNASGCLDALAAPEVARQLDAFVTKTVTPLPREGSAPPRIAETAHGMLNAIGLANPGRERFLADHLPRLRELGIPLWVSVGGFCAGGLRRDLLAPVRHRGDRAQSLLPERRRGGRFGRGDRLRLPPGDGAAALREALRRAPRRRRGRACRRGSRRGRALADQHAPRDRARQAAPTGARPRQRRPLGPSAQADRPPRGERLPRGHRSSDRRDGRDRDRPRRARVRGLRRAATSRSEPSSSPIPAPRHAFAPSSQLHARMPALPHLTTRGAWQKARKPSEKSPLDAHGRIGKIGRP